MKLNFFNHKIKVNQAQYEVDREAAKISSLSSKKLKSMNI